MINLVKIRKTCQFLTTLEKTGEFSGAPQAKIRIFAKFWRFRLKFKGLLGERRRRERKLRNILQESSIFSLLEEKAAQIVDVFVRLGGGECWSTLSTPLATGL